MSDILKGYADAATPSFIARYNAFDCAQLYAPVLDLLPCAPVRVADIGAGIGRDAAWFGGQGHEVIAIEPVRELREAGRVQHSSERITWLDDRLPDLERVQTLGPFGLVTVNGVWQHLNHPARQTGMIKLGRIVAPGGVLVMSLRHGEGASGRPAFPLSADETIDAAEQSGFSLMRRSETDSIQPANREAGVRWTWLAFTKASQLVPLS